MNNQKMLQKLQQTQKSLVQLFEQQDQQDEMLKILADNINKSFIGKKSKQKPQDIKIQDIKPQPKINISHSKSHINIADLRVSSLPNFNILKVQNMNQNSNNGCWCSMISKSEQLLYFVIQQPSRLIMYKKGTQKIVYSFNFDTMEVETDQQFDKNDSQQFLLIAQKLTLRITHDNKMILREWYKRIEQLTKQSYGKQFHIKSISQPYQDTFYTKLFCTEDQFTQNCQTGDVLLFQDQHFFAKAQRFILNADYDHVAMVIRDSKYGILMFQANSFKGVSLTPWNCMVKFGWYKYIRRIVWRKLQNVERSNFFKKVIHQFVNQNLKQKYYISFEKLLSNKSYVGIKQQEKGFFCSELIAKVYKDLQILTRDQNNPNYIASSKLYPYHFSQKFNLKLEKGTLSRQYDIHFNEDVLKKQYGQKFFRK